MYGVVDIGSNTIRLVLYKVENNTVKQMLNKKSMAGLAGYISGRKMTPKGIGKAVEVLRECRQALDNIQTQEVFVFATASLRGIDNTSEVLQAIWEQCGFEVQVLSGKEEATFDYYGAVHSLQLTDGLLADIGGGSTELVFYKDKEILFSESLPIGSLNMYTRFVSGIVPTRQELLDIEKETLSQLKKLRLPTKGLSTEKLCGVGGTLRASCKLYNELYNVCPQAEKYSRNGVEGLLENVQDKRLISAVLKICPERIHTVFPGLAILKAVMDQYGCQTIDISSFGVREGYLYYHLQERGILHG